MQVGVFMRQSETYHMLHIRYTVLYLLFLPTMKPTNTMPEEPMAVGVINKIPTLVRRHLGLVLLL